MLNTNLDYSLPIYFKNKILKKNSKNLSVLNIQHVTKN